ncbi:MAG: hypothetical protein KME10_24835 [Plectolyngbya sp. WJT66-NPBG17]|jgi:hypothetical protein|nr:hypothetical protein [Plectolyngbya sp. WJT66-NPBG17]
MTFPAHTIRLGAAQAIFSNANISEIKIGDKTVGYRAMFNGAIEDAALTSLCQRLWQAAIT